MNEKSKYILILRSTDDKRLQYITARKLGVLWPETQFAQWKAKVESGDSVILLRSDSLLEIGRYKKELDEIGAPVEIVEQKSIGGAKVF